MDYSKVSSQCVTLTPASVIYLSNGLTGKSNFAAFSRNLMHGRHCELQRQPHQSPLSLVHVAMMSLHHVGHRVSRLRMELSALAHIGLGALTVIYTFGATAVQEASREASIMLFALLWSCAALWWFHTLTLRRIVAAHNDGRPLERDFAFETRHPAAYWFVWLTLMGARTINLLAMGGALAEEGDMLCRGAVSYATCNFFATDAVLFAAQLVLRGLFLVAAVAHHGIFPRERPWLAEIPYPVIHPAPQAQPPVPPEPLSLENSRYYHRLTPVATLECCVCLDGSSDDAADATDATAWAETRCGHAVHWKCLERWLTEQQPRTCPLCRGALQSPV
jgi:hypothetical protein